MVCRAAGVSHAADRDRPQHSPPGWTPQAPALPGAGFALPLETSIVQAGDDAGVHEFLMRESGRGRSAAPEPTRHQPAAVVPAPVTRAAATVQQYFDAPAQ